MLAAILQFSLSPSLVFQLRGISGEDLHWSYALLHVPFILSFFVAAALFINLKSKYAIPLRTSAYLCARASFMKSPPCATLLLLSFFF